MAFCEGVPGTRFEIRFEALGSFLRLECGVEFQFPRDELGRVWTSARVVVAKFGRAAGREGAENLSRVTDAMEDVRVKHETGLPSVALNPGGPPPLLRRSYGGHHPSL